MYVYLRNEGQIVRVPSVTLKDCHRPSVGTYVEERIEPALWYKVLILDSIYIDCDNRVIYWNCHRDEESGTMHATPSFELTPGKLSTYYHDKGLYYTSSTVLYLIVEVKNKHGIEDHYPQPQA